MRSLSAVCETDALTVVVTVTSDFLELSCIEEILVIGDSKRSTLRFRLKLLSLVNNDELAKVDDESDVLLVDNFVVEKNDDDDDDVRAVLLNVDEGILGAVLNRDDDGLAAVLNKLDDDDNGLVKLLDKVDDVNRLDDLVVLAPVKRELVVLSVDEDERLDPCNNELPVGVVVLVDKSEFLVDNNEDAEDGFFGSAIFLLLTIEKRYNVCNSKLKAKALNTLTI